MASDKFLLRRRIGTS